MPGPPDQSDWNPFTLNHSEKTFSKAPPFDAKLLQLLWSSIGPFQLAIGHLDEFSNGDTFPTERSEEAPEVRATLRLLHSDLREGPTPISTPPGLI